MKSDLFLNDNFKILKYLIDNETINQETKLVMLSQGDIAKELKMGKRRVNVALKEFIDNGLISIVGPGKYIIHEDGKKIFNYLNKGNIIDNNKVKI